MSAWSLHVFLIIVEETAEINGLGQDLKDEFDHFFAVRRESIQALVNSHPALTVEYLVLPLQRRKWIRPADSAKDSCFSALSTLCERLGGSLERFIIDIANYLFPALLLCGNTETLYDAWGIAPP